MNDRAPWLRAIAMVGIAAALLPACSADATPATTSGTPGAPSPQGSPGPALVADGDVTTGLDVPWSIAFVGAAPIVSERDTGLIREVLPDGDLRTVGEVDNVTHEFRDGGLMGLAAHDDGVFVYYTSESGNRIARYDIEGEPGSLTLGDGSDIAEFPAAPRHNGGRIAVGPDGMLYVGVGDNGEGSTAQDVDELAGKILRIRPDGRIPADNPFPGSPVYSLGHRNVQGIAWAADGTMFASEFGDNTWDELNVIEAGANYGWPEVEGIGGAPEFVDPVQQWNPEDASPSGITIVDDVIYLANLRGERLRAVPVADPGASSEYFTQEYGRLRDVVAAPDGTLWLLTNNTSESEAREGDDRIVSVTRQ